MIWLWVTLVIIVVLWLFVPAIQLFIADAWLDREFEIPEELNGGVTRDGVDPSGRYIWTDGKSVAIKRAGHTSQSPPRGRE